MTERQMEAAKRSLPRYCDKPYNKWTDEEKRLSAELSCRSMINSCLAYGGIQGFWQEHSWRVGDKSYAAPHIRSLGRKRVEELVAEQEADFAKAILLRNVFTDNEGVTYNSIVWADEQDDVYTAC